MTKKEAEKMLVERFDALNQRAEEKPENGELVALTDSMHKLYITLVNAGAFDGSGTPQPTNGIIN